VKSVILVSVPVTFGVQLIEAVVPLSGSTLQLLSPVDKAKRKLSQRKCKRERDERKRGGKGL
jgi:hypothetical protein